MFSYIAVALAVVVVMLFAGRRLFKKKRPTRSKVDAVVFSGPSGVGKGTIIKRLMEERPTTFGFCISHTTRPPRDGEVNGVNYYFVSVDEMKRMESQKEFLECCSVHGNMYGTSKKALRDVQASGRVPIIEIDVQGAQKLKAQQGTMTFYYVFISAPSIDELKNRIVARGQESDEKVKTRLETARKELEFVTSAEGKKLYDKTIVNDKLEQTITVVKNVLKLYCGI